MEDVKCDGDDHRFIQKYVHAIHSLRLITEMVQDIEGDKVRRIESAIDKLTVRYSFFMTPSDAQIRADVEFVWNMVYKLAVRTSFNNQCQEALVHLLVCVKHSPPVPRLKKEGQPPPSQKSRKPNLGEKKGQGSKAKVKPPSTCSSSNSSQSGGVPIPPEEGNIKGREEKKSGTSLPKDARAVAEGVSARLDGVSNEASNPPSTLQIDKMTLWQDLPYLDVYLLEKFTKLANLPLLERCNFAFFVGRMISASIDDYKFGLLALWLIREALEKPRTLNEVYSGDEDKDEESEAEETHTEGKKKGKGKKNGKGKAKRNDQKKQNQQQKQTKGHNVNGKSLDDLALNDLLPPCVALIESCGKKLAELSKKNITYKGENKKWAVVGKLAKAIGEDEAGFSLKRWMYWRTRLKSFIRYGLRGIVYDARRALNVLCNAGRMSGIRIPGDMEYFQNVVRYRIKHKGKDARDTNDDLQWVEDWVGP
ncbi:hypothetical protein MauCBS54593_002011 [Microsporum audouinii]